MVSTIVIEWVSTVSEWVGVLGNVLMFLVVLKGHLYQRLPSPAYCLAGFAIADLCKLAGALYVEMRRLALDLHISPWVGGASYWLYYFGVWSGVAWLGAYTLSLHRVLCSESNWALDVVLVHKPGAGNLSWTRWRPWSDASRSQVLMRWTVCWLLPILVVGVTILVRTVEQEHLTASSVQVYPGEYCPFHHNASTVAFFPCSIEVLLTDVWVWLVAAFMLVCFVKIQLHLAAKNRNLRGSVDKDAADKIQHKLRLWPHFALYIAAFFICPFPRTVYAYFSNKAVSKSAQDFGLLTLVMSNVHGAINLIVYGGTQMWFDFSLRWRHGQRKSRSQSVWHVDGSHECELAMGGRCDSSKPSAMASSRQKSVSSLIPVSDLPATSGFTHI